MTENISALYSCKSREQAEAILDDKFPSLKDLCLLAKELDLPIYQSKKKLRDKIVESTVGFRLTSKAIRDET